MYVCNTAAQMGIGDEKEHDMPRGMRMNEERRPENQHQEEPYAEGKDPSVTRAPDYKIQLGRVQAAVWLREIDGRMVSSVTLTRSFKDEHEMWHRTNQLDEIDLLPATEALRDAYRWIQEQRHQARQEANQDLRMPPRSAHG